MGLLNSIYSFCAEPPELGGSAHTIEVMIFIAKGSCIQTTDHVQTVQLADEMPQSCRESL